MSERENAEYIRKEKMLIELSLSFGDVKSSSEWIQRYASAYRRAYLENAGKVTLACVYRLANKQA